MRLTVSWADWRQWARACLLQTVYLLMTSKTATIQYKPVTSLAGNNNALAHYEQSHGFNQILRALSNIHGLYGCSCNLFDDISVYSLNPRKLPGRFSYERPGYEASFLPVKLSTVDLVNVWGPGDLSHVLHTRMISYFLQFSISSTGFWVVKSNILQANSYPIMSLLADFLLGNASSTEHVLWNWAMVHPNFISISGYLFCLTLWMLELVFFFFWTYVCSFVKALLMNTL